MSTSGGPGRLILEDRLEQGIAIARATGEIDIATSSLLREALLRVVADEDSHGLVVNLAGVTFMDSTGPSPGSSAGLVHRAKLSRCGALFEWRVQRRRARVRRYRSWVRHRRWRARVWCRLARLGRDRRRLRRRGVWCRRHRRRLPQRAAPTLSHQTSTPRGAPPREPAWRNLVHVLRFQRRRGRLIETAQQCIVYRWRRASEANRGTPAAASRPSRSSMLIVGDL